MIHAFPLLLCVSFMGVRRSARPRLLKQDVGRESMQGRRHDPIKAGIWSLAAASRNPFEFIPNGENTTGVTEEDDVQRAVADVIRTLQTAVERENNDEPIKDIFTQDMFEELLDLSRNASAFIIKQNRTDWSDSELTQYWNILKDRLAYSGYLTDGELDLGYSRLLSWPDRYVNTLKKATGESEFRPTVINCYDKPLRSAAHMNQSDWWLRWKEFMFLSEEPAWMKLRDMDDNYKDMMLPIAMALSDSSSERLETYDFGLRQGSFGRYLPRSAILRQMEWPLVVSKQVYSDTAKDIEEFEKSSWYKLANYSNFEAPGFPMLQRNDVCTLRFVKNAKVPSRKRRACRKEMGAPANEKEAWGEIGTHDEPGTLLRMAAKAQTKLSQILGNKKPWASKEIAGNILRTTKLSHFADLIVDPGIKGSQRIHSKANFKYQESHATKKYRRVLDIARFGLIYRSCRGLLEGVQTILADKRFNVVAIDNRFHNPTGLGWRDMQVLVALTVPTDGARKGKKTQELHIAELQLTHKKLFDSRKGLHRHFAFMREFLPAIPTKDGEGGMNPLDTDLVLNYVDAALVEMRKEEEKASLRKRKSSIYPIRKQLLHLAVYDAIVVHGVTKPAVSTQLTELANVHSELEVTGGQEFSDSRRFVCSQSTQLKEASGLNVLAAYLKGLSHSEPPHGRDVMFLINVKEHQAKNLSGTLAKTYHVVQPDTYKPQNAMMFIDKARFKKPKKESAQEWGLNPKRFPESNLLMAEVHEEQTKRKYIVAAFAARKEGRDSLAVLDAVQALAKSRGGAALVGFTSNTFGPSAIEEPMGFLLEGVEEFLWKSMDDGLKSIFDGKGEHDTVTTNRGRSFLQPQVQDAVNIKDYKTSGKVDRNPKDHILYDRGLLTNRCDTCDADDFTRHNRAAPEASYDGKLAFPTAEFPSHHALVEASLWPQLEFMGDEDTPARELIAEY